MSWPEELARWATDLVADEHAIATVLKRAGFDRDRATEALHQALVSAARLYQRLPLEKRDYRYFRAWMCAKARNLMIDEFRSNRSVTPLRNEELVPSRQLDESSAERAVVVREAIEEFPTDTQHLLWLRAQGYTLQEIASNQKVSAGTIHRRLRQPLQQLRERLLQLDVDLFESFRRTMKGR